MSFNDHSELSGRHAFLSPSSHHWLNYDDQKLEARFHSHQSAKRGTDLHDLAKRCIELDVKLAKSETALYAYVADGIRYRMVCEQPLYYSNNCFGTPDTLSFTRNKLRIHDLKTGLIVTSMAQLKVYAALFCLEYQVDPFQIEIILRIYQRGEIREEVPFAEEIVEIMDKIVDSDNKIEMFRAANR